MAEPPETHDRGPASPLDPGPTAVGTWSGGPFIPAGEADRMLGRAIEGRPRGEMCVVGAVGHDFYTGERDGAKGFPRFTDLRLRDASGYAGYLRMATERSLE